MRMINCAKTNKCLEKCGNAPELECAGCRKFVAMSTEDARRDMLGMAELHRSIFVLARADALVGKPIICDCTTRPRFARRSESDDYPRCPKCNGYNAHDYPLAKSRWTTARLFLRDVECRRVYENRSHAVTVATESDDTDHNPKTYWSKYAAIMRHMRANHAALHGRSLPKSEWPSIARSIKAREAAKQARLAVSI